MIDYTNMNYTKNETKQLWLIGPGAICDEN